MRRVFLLIIIFIVLFVSCQPTTKANTNTVNTETNKIAVNEENESTYTPPANGLISEEQANRYIEVAKAFNNAILEQVQIMDEFYKKYNIAGKDEIDKLKDNKEAMKEWNNIMEKWNEKEQSIYKKHNMTSDEFDWIASALIDPKNAKMQKKIADALEPKIEENNQESNK